MDKIENYLRTHRDTYLSFEETGKGVNVDFVKYRHRYLLREGKECCLTDHPREDCWHVSYRYNDYVIGRTMWGFHREEVDALFADEYGTVHRDVEESTYGDNADLLDYLYGRQKKSDVDMLMDDKTLSTRSFLLDARSLLLEDTQRMLRCLLPNEKVFPCYPILVGEEVEYFDFCLTGSHVLIDIASTFGREKAAYHFSLKNRLKVMGYRYYSMASSSARNEAKLTSMVKNMLKWKKRKKMHRHDGSASLCDV